jgi:hypothetical protein
MQDAACARSFTAPAPEAMRVLAHPDRRSRIEFLPRVAHRRGVNQPPPEHSIRVEWLHEFRSCVARAGEAASPGLSITFNSHEPVLDPIARLRMENAAIEALRRLLET